MSRDALDALWAAMHTRPDALAFRLGFQRMTFGQLEQAARRYASLLEAQGLQPGDRVACLLDSSLELVVALVGHYLLGLVHVPINTRYGRLEIAHILDDAEPSALLVDSSLDQADIVRELAQDRTLMTVGETSTAGEELAFAHGQTLAPWSGEPLGDDDDLALIIYTSGTTGRSKGACLSRRNVVHNIDALTRLWRWQPDDELVLALPLFHVHGLGIGIHGTLLRGNRCTIQPRFEAEAVARACAAGATIFMGVPTMYVRLLRWLEENPDERTAMLRHVRLMTSGSAPLAAHDFARFEALTGHRILERYGMSETLLTLSNPYPPHERKPGAVGFPVGDTEVRLVEGELRVRGSSVMSQGYWRAPDRSAEAFDEEGWFRTGDIVERDDEGYLHIVGRSSVDIIKCGGYKIGAREIEDALLRHPDLEEVAVLGAPDEEWGQRIVAALVAKARSPARSPSAWLEALATVTEDLADYKRPRQVLLLDALPRNALGKVQKHKIALPET